MVFGRTPLRQEIKELLATIFQFPVGIRWCSDPTDLGLSEDKLSNPFNSLWELDGVRTG